MSQTVLSFGETLWDLLPGGAVLGGAPCNFALRLHWLGDRAVLITRLGRDELGKKALTQLQLLGLDTTHVQRDGRRSTGTVNVALDDHGVPDFTIVPDVAYDYIEADADLQAQAQSADCFCFGTLSQRSAASRQTLQTLLDSATSALKLLDINLRKDCYSDETIAESLRRADLLKLNENEAQFLGERFDLPAEPLREFCDRMLDRWNLKLCLVTLGERGALAATRDGRRVYAPGFEVRLADTCGSGDAFTAGFIHQYLRGESLAKCCEFGNALGALVATQSGGTTPVAVSEIDAFLNAQPPRIVHGKLKDLVSG